MRKLLKIFGCLVCGLTGNSATADPFAWELAEVNTARVAFIDGTEVRYRVGHIYTGNYVDASVVIDHPPFGPSDTDTVLFESMNLSVPTIHAWEAFFVVEDTGVLWGQYEPTTHFRCWSPGDMFSEVDCPAGLSP